MMKSLPGAPKRRGMRRVLAGAAALALGGAGLIAATPAQAAEQEVKDATFKWSVNDESTGGSYFGGCNFLVAGKAGDAGSSKVWSAADADKLISGGSTDALKDGNVSIHKSDGKPGTFDNKCKTAGGTSVNSTTNAQADDNHTGDYVQLEGGTGSIDPETDSGEISWKGSFTFVYYGGMTYWTITNPKMIIKDGVGKMTGTYSGVGADMDDPSVWVPDLTKTKDYDKDLFVDGTIMDIGKTGDNKGKKIDLKDDGAKFTPDFLGVKTDRDGRNPQADKTGTNKSWWGSMPDAWVAFNQLTNQDSYWYTTDGGEKTVQPRKSTNDVTLSYELEEPESAEFSGDTSHDVTKASAADGLQVKVTGKDYKNLPKTSAGKDTVGTYSALIPKDHNNEFKSDDVKGAAFSYWGAGGNSADSWTGQVNVKADDIDKTTDYDVVVWAAHGDGTDDTVLYRKALSLTDDQKEALWPSGTEEPTESESPEPSETEEPSQEPTESESPSTEPTESEEPTQEPTDSQEPSQDPSETEEPSQDPTESEEPSSDPTDSESPSTEPSESEEPSQEPSESESATSEPSATESSSQEPSSTESAAEPALSIAPKKISAKNFVNEKKGVKLTVSGLSKGQKVDYTVSPEGDSVKDYSYTATANADGVAQWAVYGQDSKNPDVYVGKYAVKASVSSGDAKAAKAVRAGDALSGSFSVTKGDSNDDDPNGGSGDDGSDDNGNGGSGDGSDDNGNGGSGSDDGNGSGNGDLPKTGMELTAAGAGLALLLIGGVAVLLARRKRN